MKLDHQKLENAYIAKINQICEDCEDKEHFSIPEIISIIAGLIDSGEFYLPPSKATVLELYSTRNKLLSEWSKETSDFVDELYARLEWAETEAEVFNLCLKGEWTVGSRLYTQKQLDKIYTKNDKISNLFSYTEKNRLTSKVKYDMLTQRFFLASYDEAT